MLPKKHRITVPQFWKNSGTYKKTATSHITCFAKPGSSNSLRIAIYVPKHLDKRSASRHETRRVIVESVRKHVAKSGKKGDFLLRADRLIKKNERNLIEKELKNLIIQEKNNKKSTQTLLI